MPVCKTSEIQEGELYRFDIQDKALLVVRIKDDFFVSDSTCTHEEADLSLGILSGDIVTCPLHRAKFNLESGNVIIGPDGADPSRIPRLRTYKSKVENGELWADI